MADLSDVEDGFLGYIAGVLYPAGVSQPSIIGSTCRCYRGWPNSTTLSNDLSSGIVNVTVVSDNDSGRTTTRYMPRYVTSTSVPGTQVSAANGQITIWGAPSVGDVVGVEVDGLAYAYRIQPGDTADLVASNIVVLIQAARPAMATGATISLPGSRTVRARCVADAQGWREDRRQEKDIRIISWCPSAQIRDSACSALDAAFSQMSFLPLPDGTTARIQYKGTASYDQAENALLYRRDLVFCTEYPTLNIAAQPAMLFGRSVLNGNPTLG